MTSLYLSRLRLRLLSREAQYDLANCASMHRRLLMAFPDQEEITRAREHYGVLYRIEPARASVGVLVQSRERPDWSRLPKGYLLRPASEPKRVDSLYAHIAEGQELIFRLRANPTRSISERNTRETERWRGKRVELRREEDQMAWLQRKGEAGGFELLHTRRRAEAGAPGQDAEVPDVRTTGLAQRVVGRSGERRLTFGSVVFDGRLRVTNPATFRHALEHGIGSGKAFGFGLLSVAPVAGAH